MEEVKEENGLLVNVVLREARYTKLPYGFGRAVVCVDTVRPTVSGGESRRETKRGALWSRIKNKDAFTTKSDEEARHKNGNTCEDALEFYVNETASASVGEIFTFYITDPRNIDRLDIFVEIWSEASEDEKQHRVKIGEARAKAHLLVSGLLLDEWRPIETDPALGELRFAISVSTKNNAYTQHWHESFRSPGPAVEASAEYCAERRRQKDWAQHVSWQRIVKANNPLAQHDGVLFALIRKKNDEAHTLYESWGFGVDLLQIDHSDDDNNEPTKHNNDDTKLIVSQVYDAGGRLEEDIAPGDILLACSRSYQLHHLEMFDKHLVAAKFDCDAAARHTLDHAAGLNGTYVWLIVKRPRQFTQTLLSAQHDTQNRGRRPSFLASMSSSDGGESRDALRDLAWRGFARRNRQEVYRGVAFAMEFLSTKRQRRTSSVVIEENKHEGEGQQRKSVLESRYASSDSYFSHDRHGLPLSVSHAVSKCVSAFTHHPRNETTSDWHFEQDEEARLALETALASQQRDAHSENLRETWRKRQLSFEDALSVAARRQSRAKTQPQQHQDNVFTAVKRRSSRLLRRITSRRRSSTGSNIVTGSSSSSNTMNDSLDDAPRWIIDSLLVATQCALERAPLPGAEQMSRGQLLGSRENSFTHLESDSEGDGLSEHYDLPAHRLDIDTSSKRHTFDSTPSTTVVPATPVAAQMTPRLHTKFLNFRDKRKVSPPTTDIASEPALLNGGHVANKKNRSDRLAFLSERVSRAYLARNSSMSEIDGGIHEPTARALAAILLDKVGVDDRTTFYVLAFFFEELAAEAAIHGDRDKDVASICAALFRKRQPALAAQFERANFPCNPAVLEVWLTLFPVALSDLALLRWLDVLLFEGWEGLVNLALVWYDHYAIEISQALKRAFISSTTTSSTWRPCATVVATLRDILASSSDVDFLLAKVKAAPNEELHSHALEIDEICDGSQDQTACHLFDVVMHDVERQIEQLDSIDVQSNNEHLHEEDDSPRHEEQIMLYVEDSASPQATDTTSRLGHPQHTLLPDVTINAPPRAPRTPRTPRHRELRLETSRTTPRRKRSASDDEFDLPTPSPAHRKKSPPTQQLSLPNSESPLAQQEDDGSLCKQ